MKNRPLALTLALLTTPLAWTAQFSDPADDTTGPDLRRLDYQVANQAIDLKLTFAEELVGSVIDPAVQTSILLDADRSNFTGFTSGPGLHTRFGADYEIEVFLAGFGPTSNSAELRYWRRKVSSLPPFMELERVQVALGDWFDPNGSVFVVGADTTYGTDNRQVFLRVPLDLFSNAAFPICGEGTVCINERFPCPPTVPQNVRTAYLSVMAMDPYDFNGTADVLPDQGMIDTASNTVLPSYPADDTDLVAAATDPGNDGVAQPGNNGEELVGLKVFRHAGDVMAFELKLSSYSLEDTAIYYVALDLDDNPDTGEPWVNGSVALGIDLIAEFANFDNPIGWANPLEGTVYFRQSGQWCPLIYNDYLANVWRSTPGYVFITLPAEYTAPELAANASGLVKVVALTGEPGLPFFNDAVPDEGALSFAIRPPISIAITSIVPQPQGKFRLALTCSASPAPTLSIRTATRPDGPWTPDPTAIITSLGGGNYEAILKPDGKVRAGYWRASAAYGR